MTGLDARYFLTCLSIAGFLAACGGARTTSQGGEDSTTPLSLISCSTSEQCIGGTCVSGFCTLGSQGAIGAGCSGATDCVSERCENGTCEPQPSACGRDDDCDDGAFCHYASGPAARSGICRPACTGDAACYLGQRCFSGRCYTLNECASGDANCRPGEECEPISRTCRWPLDSEVDRCIFEGPESVDALSGEQIEVSARLFEAGVTDVSPGADPSAAVVAEWGFGPTGSEPSTWTWISGSADGEWSDSSYPGEDRYVVHTGAPTAGTYSHAFRFSVNGGRDHLVCDLDGSDNGIDASMFGALTTSAGPCEPNPCTTPPSPTCADDGVTRQGYPTPGECAVVFAAAACDYEAELVDCSTLGGTCDAGACDGVAVAPDTPGQVIVTEFMARAQSGMDSAEWVELTSTSSTTAFDLSGCRLHDDGGDSHTIASQLILLPGESVVLAASDNPAENGGLDVDYRYGEFYLGNSGDEISLQCDSTTIDRVVYTSAWVETGVSIQLDPELLADGAGDPALNDSLDAYCLSTASYGTAGYKGTPGSANTSCDASPPIDVCDPNPCTSPPSPRCEGDVLEVSMSLGDCTIVNESAVCQYDVTATDCAASGTTCSAGTCQGAASAAPLIISEVVEGDGLNKMVEISASGSANLSGCKVEVYFNGSSSVGSSIALPTVTLSDETFVLCADGAFDQSTRDALCDMTTGSALFNGNDAIALVCADGGVDVVGQIGSDPGSGGWGGVGANRTLWRKCSASADPVGSDAFSAADWEALPLNSITGIGSTTCAP